jgi:hypothetical protein
MHLLVWILNLSFALRRVRVTREKPLLSFVLSVRLQVSLRLTLDVFVSNFDVGAFYENLWRKFQISFKMGQKCRALYRKTWVRVCCWRQYEMFRCSTTVQLPRFLGNIQQFYIDSGICSWTVLFRFGDNNGYANVPRCYVTRALPVWATNNSA